MRPTSEFAPGVSVICGPFQFRKNFGERAFGQLVVLSCEVQGVPPDPRHVVGIRHGEHRSFCGLRAITHQSPALARRYMTMAR
ncbi:MAG: hypothetical protein K0R61_4358 [Microvirga sp.]|nr:hypothetical protein [Microvirga sp.]